VTVDVDTADAQRRRELAELVDAHGQALWALVRKLCRHQQDAEDAFQETAVRAWKHLAGGRAIDNRRAWLLTIGYRVFLDQRRKTKPCDAFDDVADARSKPPSVEAESNEEAGRVQAAINELPNEVREVFVLHYTGGLSIQETAAAMGIAAGTAKSRLAAGLNQLRRRLR
jgi:RNA polymerase sigma-70 factor (ECF subfamily)